MFKILFSKSKIKVIKLKVFKTMLYFEINIIFGHSCAFSLFYILQKLQKCVIESPAVYLV